MLGIGLYSRFRAFKERFHPSDTEDIIAMPETQAAPKYLSKSSPGQTRTFSIPISSSASKSIPRKDGPSDSKQEEKSVQINITELALSADNLSHETWASSYILASLIHRLNINFSNTPTTGPSQRIVIPVVELGAGTGLVGLTAATCWDQKVVLTDLSPIVPGLRANVDVNTTLLDSVGDKGVTVECGTLDWVRPDQLLIPAGDASSNEKDEVFDLSSTKAHVLLAADTCYSTEHPRLLSGVILKWLHRHPDARVVLGTALRVAYLEEITELWNRLEEGGMEVAAQGQEEAREQDFDDERLVEWSLWRWKTSSLTVSDE